MEIAIIGAALMMGLATSIHCIGMCGPIAISMGITANNKQYYIQNGLYQIGRAFTYAFLGAIVGVFTEALQLLVYQNYISIIAGIVIILMALFPIITNQWMAANKSIHTVLSPMKQRLQSQLRMQSPWARFLTGIFNGFLPCGPVYMALVAAIGTGSWWNSSLFMFLFGIGTIPLMFALVYLGGSLQGKWRNRLSKIIPIISIIIGVLFILRGLNLGIPMLSPSKEMLLHHISQ